MIKLATWHTYNSLAKLPASLLETIGYVKFSRHALRQRLTKSPTRRQCGEEEGEEGEERLASWHPREPCAPVPSAWPHYRRWMKTSPEASRKAMLAPTEGFLSPRWGSARLQQPSPPPPLPLLPPPLRGILLSETAPSPPAPGDVSGHSHPGADERPAAAGRGQPQQRKYLGQFASDKAALARQDSEAKTLSRV